MLIVHQLPGFRLQKNSWCSIMSEGISKKTPLLSSDGGFKKIYVKVHTYNVIHITTKKKYTCKADLSSVTKDRNYIVYFLYSVFVCCLPAFKLWTSSRKGYMHYISSCQSKRTHAILIFLICTSYLAEKGKPSSTIRKTTGFGPRLSQRAKGVSDLWCANFQKLLRENRHADHLWFRH